MKKLSHVLTTLAIINLVLFPATAIEPPLAESSPSTNYSSGENNPIKNGTETNSRYCFYVSWAGVWWCY